MGWEFLIQLPLLLDLPCMVHDTHPAIENALASLRVLKLESFDWEEEVIKQPHGRGDCAPSPPAQICAPILRPARKYLRNVLQYRMLVFAQHNTRMGVNLV